MKKTADYRHTLKMAFETRREKDPSYSLRSYARDLSVSTSMLSEVLNYKKNLTRKTAMKINAALKLSKNDSRLFLLSVDLDSPSVGQSRETIQKQIEHYADYGKSITLADDQFAYISDPKHLVLLSLIRLRNFKNNLSWIAKKMGIFQHQVNSLMARLKKLNIVEDDVKSQGLANHSHDIKINHQFIFTSDGSSAQGVREFHKATLNHALQAVETVPVRERDFCTSIFAIDQNDLEEMQKDVRDFQDRMYQKYSKKPTADRVYAIQNQLVPYTTRSKE